MHRPLRWLALSLVLLTAACGRGSELASNAAFVPGQNPKALMVVGINVDRLSTFLGLPAFGTARSLGMTWTKLENGKAPEREADRTEASFVRTECLDGGLLVQRAQPCDIRQVSRHVLLVDPGDYQLTSVTRQANAGMALQTIQTRYLDTAALIVSIKPGEVVYVGDFTYDILLGPARLLRTGRDDEAARRTLAAYPGVAPAPLVFRPPVPRSQLYQIGGRLSDEQPGGAGDEAGTPSAPGGNADRSPAVVPGS